MTSDPNRAQQARLDRAREIEVKLRKLVAETLPAGVDPNVIFQYGDEGVEARALVAEWSRLQREFWA